MAKSPRALRSGFDSEEHFYNGNINNNDQNPRSNLLKNAAHLSADEMTTFPDAPAPSPPPRLLASQNHHNNNNINYNSEGSFNFDLRVNGAATDDELLVLMDSDEERDFERSMAKPATPAHLTFVAICT